MNLNWAVEQTRAGKKARRKAWEPGKMLVVDDNGKLFYAKEGDEGLTCLYNVEDIFADDYERASVVPQELEERVRDLSAGYYTVCYGGTHDPIVGVDSVYHPGKWMFSISHPKELKAPVFCVTAQSELAVWVAAERALSAILNEEPQSTLVKD
jgi:hypothetical protein